MRKLIIGTAAVALATACSSKESSEATPAAAAGAEEQSEAEAWRAACDVTRQRVDELNQVAPVDRQRLLGEMVSSVMKSSRARADFSALAAQSPAERRKSLAAAIARAGIDSCHLADVLAHDAAIADCQQRGDAAACVKAADVYQRDKLLPGRAIDSRRFRELACTHGDGASCAALAGTGDGEDAEAWRLRACHRGHAPSCAEIDDLVRVKVRAEADDPAGTRIENAYAGAFADCVTAAGDALKKRGRVELTIERPTETSSLTIGPAPKALSDCLMTELPAWRLPETQQRSIALSVEWHWTTRETADDIAAKADMAIAQMFAVDDSDSATEATLDSKAPGEDLASAIERAESKTPKPGAPPKSKMTLGAVTPQETASLTGIDVGMKIRRAYSAGVKRCHQRTLKIDEKAEGTVRLKLRVGETGRVTRAKASGFGYPRLDKCIENQARRWRFSAPKDDDGDPTDVDFSLTLTLEI